MQARSPRFPRFPRFLGLALIAVFTPLSQGFADGTDAIVGQCVTQEGRARIEIAEVQGTYGGRIVWLKEPLYPPDDPEAGTPRRDRRNPDPSKRNRPVLGLRLLGGLRYAGDGKWNGGVIYNVETGKTYRCKATIKDRHTLKLRGYLLLPLFGKSQTWTRMADDRGGC